MYVAMYPSYHANMTWLKYTVKFKMYNLTFSICVRVMAASVENASARAFALRMNATNKNAKKNFGITYG